MLGEVVGDVLPELPPIQREALEAALLLGDSALGADPRSVAAAFLGALRLLAAERPLCLAVDDVQWLDAASLSAIRYAVARLRHERVATVLAVRDEVPEWLSRAVPESRLRTIRVRGLSLGATHELLRNRLDATFARPVLIKLWEASGGNPFFALELGAALQRRGGTLDAGEDLPIPTALDQLLHVRLDALGAEALDVAPRVAALADPTVALVEAAVGAGYEAGLAETLAASILEAGPGAPQIHPSAARIGRRRAPDAVASADPARAARRGRSDSRGASSPPCARDGRAGSCDRRDPRERLSTRHTSAARRPGPPTWPSRHCG